MLEPACVFTSITVLSIQSCDTLIQVIISGLIIPSFGKSGILGANGSLPDCVLGKYIGLGQGS